MLLMKNINIQKEFNKKLFNVSQSKPYEITNLVDTKEFLNNYRDPIIITNANGSIRYYGMIVLNYMFCSIVRDFKHVSKIIINAEDDNAGLLTAIRLGYKDIIYNGNIIIDNRN